MASPVTGGYDQEFLDAPAKVKEFECPLCLLVTREPNQTSCCGHDFCQSCINRVLTDRKPCPLCKEANFSSFLDKKQRRKVLELKVQCSKRDRGCDWTGELEELTTHTDTQNGTCSFVDVTCPNNCGESHQRRHMDTHLSDTCQNRPFTCVHCNYESTYKLVINHYDQCSQFPLKCPNKCEIDSVEREKMAEHLSECPLQLVECEYAHAGCSEKVQRKDLAMHMERNVQKHLLLAFTASQKRIAALEEMQREQAEAMERQMAEKDRHLKEKDQQIEMLKKRVSVLEKHVPIGLSQPEFNISNYSKYKEKFVERHGLFMYTRPREAKLQVAVYFAPGGLWIKPYQLPGEFDEEIQWPVKCTVTVLILNQLSDRSHINAGTKALSLTKPTERYHIGAFAFVVYSGVEHPSKAGVQYLKEDCLKFRVYVRM